MATLKKIVRAPQLSAKTTVAPGGGMAAVFGGIADALGAAADYYRPAAMAEMQRRGTDAGMAASQGGGAWAVPSVAGTTTPGMGDGDPRLAALREFEGFRTTPYWDVNALRAGFGSDTVTAPDGTVSPVVAGTVVDRAGAERDLLRRVTTEFEPAVIAAVGADTYAALPDNSKAALVSLSYNYGANAWTDSLAGVAAAVRDGSPEDVAAAINALGGHNDGVNRNRRRREAEMFLASGAPGPTAAAYSAIVEFELDGKSRPNKPNPEVIDMLGRAAEATFGPGARVVVTSGKENEGGRAGAAKRHPLGLAADIRVYDAAGNLLSLDDPRAVTFAQNARRFGAQSIGAGDEYMGNNAFHIDMLAPEMRDPGQGSFWGSWATKNAGAIFGIPVGDAPASAPDAPAMATGPSGRTQPKLYSPYSGPLLLAYNAAAEAAYGAEVVTQAGVDFGAMMSNYALDPKGFEQASRAYIDQVVADAPQSFKAGIREGLTSDARRHLTSIMSAQQEDTRRRASNALGALTDRYSTEYADLLAAGDSEGALAASMQLQEVLRARENLPGSGWTPEQSANVMIDVTRRADEITARNTKALVSEAKSTLSTIVKAAKNGMVGADEALLRDPWVWQNLPSEAAEAQAFITLRDSFPEFFKLPPQAALEMARQVQDTPVQDGWEPDVAAAAMKAATENFDRWRTDPIQRATEVLDAKPAPMPQYVPGQEAALVEWLQERRAYGAALAANGFTERPVFLAQSEIDALSPLLDKANDPAIRGAIAGVIVAGMGTDAIQVFDALKVDTVTRMAGKMLAIGGDQQTAMMALRGQAMLADNLVTVPSERVWGGTLAPEMQDAMRGLPMAEKVRGEVLDYATAIYAAQATGVDPDTAAGTQLMREAVQMALGQTTTPAGDLAGGIQRVLGSDTLLPVGVTAAEVTRAFAMATGSTAMPHQGAGFWAGMANLGAAILGDVPRGGDPVAIWAAGNAMTYTSRKGETVSPLPHINGKPVAFDVLATALAADRLQITAMGGPFYSMTYLTGNGPVVVADATGNAIMIDLEKMIEAAR